MVFKVKHDELNQVSDIIKNDSDACSAEIDNMLSNIEKLRDIWTGEDADQFCDSIDDYLTKMKNIPLAMIKMSSAISIADKGYKELDEAFENALEAEASNYEE